MKISHLPDEKKIAKLDELFNDTKEKLRKYHFEWYMNRMFLDGNHYVYYNSVTNTIEHRPRRRGEVRVVVNKIRSQIRAIQNFATRERPKWYTKPSDTDPETIKNAHRAGKFLDYIFRHLQFDVVIEGMIDQVLNSSVAWVEVDWDENDGPQGDVRIRLHDSFDIYPDLSGGVYKGLFKGDYIFKTTQRTLESVKNDERYDKKTRKKVISDDAISQMKKRLIQKRTGRTDKKEMVTIKEVQFREDGKVKLITYGGGQILREDTIKGNEFTLIPMQVPQDPLNIIHRSWVADAIPLNKAIDRAISQKIMYVNQALIYRIIAEKGHGVNTITNEFGEIIEVNNNRRFEQWQMQPLPSALDSLVNELMMMQEDIVGAHDAIIGRLPAGARSGKTLEALQAADSNNLAGITKGLKIALTVIGQRILDIASKHYTTTRVIEITDPEENGNKYLEVIGEKAPKELKKKNAAIISSDTEVIVDIGSWLGYTRSEQRDTLLKLAEMGVIPTDELLRQFEFPNIDDLAAKAREERLEQHTLKAEIAGRNQRPGQPGTPQEPGQAQSPMDQQLVELADQENAAMMNGQDIPPTKGATLAHTQAHIDFTQSRIYQESVTPEIARVFEEHIQGELQEQGL